MGLAASSEDEEVMDEGEVGQETGTHEDWQGAAKDAAEEVEEVVEEVEEVEGEEVEEEEVSSEPAAASRTWRRAGRPPS